MLLVPLPVLFVNPWIPDLIAEESQGMANMINSNAVNFAYLSAQGLLLLNATNLGIFNSNVLFCFIGSCLVISLILVATNMKDVIRERKAQGVPTIQESQTANSKGRAVFVIK